MSATPPRGRRAVVGIVIATLCIALFILLIARVGPASIWAGLRQIGWGLTAIVAIGGLRFAARAAAWTLCLEPPHRLRFTEAFGAVISGDALGQVTPLGPIVGEPAKAALVRTRVPLAAALTALAIENVLYTLSAAAMIAAGMIALLFQFELPGALRDASEVALLLVLALFAVALWLVWRQPAVLSRTVAMIAGSGATQATQRRIERLRTLEDQVYTFAARRREALAPIVGAEIGFHALGVLEAHITLWMLMGSPPSLLVSFILEATNRLITVVFKVVPMQIGVNEAGTAWLTDILGLGSTLGVTLGIVRKVRMLFWTMAGTLLLVRRGLTPRKVIEEAQTDDSAARPTHR